MESQSDFLTETSFTQHEDGFTAMTVDCDPNIIKRERTVMAICTASSRCGCAVHHDSTIHLVADRQDPGDPYKGLDIIIQRIDPEVVIVSMAQKQLVTFLEKRFQFKLIDVTHGIHNADEVSDPAFTLAIVPNSWFKISHGEQKLIESEWIKNKGITDPQERSLTVFSKVKKSVDVCAIRAVSAIDKYLSHEFARDITSDNQQMTSAFESTIDVRTKFSQVSQATRTTTEEIRIPDDLMPIINVRYIDPGPVLSVDKFTLLSLGIFQNDKKKFRTSTNTPPPEGVVPSLYEVLDQCQSIQGKRTLRTIMMWPLQCMEEIQHRYEVVNFFVKSENRVLRDQLIIQLKNIVPLSGILVKLSQSVGGFREFTSLYKSMYAFLSIAEMLKPQSESGEIEIFRRIANMDTPQFRNTVDLIVNTIDFEASKKEQHVELCQGVNEAVEDKRLVVNELTRLCQEVEIEETARYKDTLGKPCRVMYLPRIGFLESVTFTSTSEVESIRMNKEFSYMLSTETSVYFKTKKMYDMDNQVGDVTCDLIDLQEAVVVDMQNAILEQSENILRLTELCGELDCFVAFATISQQKGFVMPELIASSQEIDVRDAFHPTQSTCHNVIPNDIRFFKEDEKSAKVMIITGPNSCGKTTYMKTTCLVIYMAHIGCFVPASRAKIPLVDAILTRLHSANSISTGLSTFATDLNQINYALARATAKSVIAVDEFGKGTQARDGFHLLKGLIIYFVSKGSSSPHVMIATHYNRLADYLQCYSDYILYKTFKVKRDLSKETIVYEFKIVDGVSESSLADQVAINAGIPSAIIQRASQIRDYITGGRAIQQRPPCGA